MSQKIIIPFLCKFQLVKKFYTQQPLLRCTRILTAFHQANERRKLTNTKIERQERLRVFKIQDNYYISLKRSLRSFPSSSPPPSPSPAGSDGMKRDGGRERRDGGGGGTIVFPATCGQRRNNESPSSGASTTGCFKTNGSYLPVPPFPPPPPLPLSAPLPPPLLPGPPVACMRGAMANRDWRAAVNAPFVPN